MLTRFLPFRVINDQHSPFISHISAQSYSALEKNVHFLSCPLQYFYKHAFFVSPFIVSVNSSSEFLWIQLHHTPDVYPFVNLVTKFGSTGLNLGEGVGESSEVCKSFLQ